ncbi:MAG: imidazoleglycerol-phosphate dehydratase HisB [Proteobacteria bacterium]|jgi:imidazoleglycerol-phosphate dehydratase / histidinol-phosphatase|nr:imidazoleglycerol-phosphate dehydratase HisB [Pseudomonadota bacterium]
MQKYAFIDRDGTIIFEPQHIWQVNGLENVFFLKNVISSLKELQNMGYKIVIVTNQDGLGTQSNPLENYNIINGKILDVLSSEGILIDEILTCPHFLKENCNCRKPKTGLVQHLGDVSPKSIMVGDRQTDIEFAQNLGIHGFLLTENFSWNDVISGVKSINARKAEIMRETKETAIRVALNLDGAGKGFAKTPLNFFNHMLEQLIKHGGFDIEIEAKGDVEIDEHHTIEDVAIALGQAFMEALASKIGIERYAFERILPMDEAIAFVAIDISNRPYLQFKAPPMREFVGDFPTEMLKHFFYTFAQNAGITLHLTIEGENTHHIVECAFKGFAKCLAAACKITSNEASSTKGVL